MCICDKEENQRYPTQNKPRVVHILTVCCVQVTIFNYRFSSSFPSSQVTSSQLISQFVLERNDSFTSCRNSIIHTFSPFLFCIPYISQGSVDKDSTLKRPFLFMKIACRICSLYQSTCVYTDGGV